MGLTTTIIKQPNIKAKKATIRVIFKFEYPKIFIESKSLLDFICKKKNIDAKKIIKGKRSKIKVGTNEKDKINGTLNDSFKFLKNSISSNKLKIIEREKKTKIVFTIIFE
tara:strand:- start:263 stop:592 length:330 start_codon:yes stop_codon:yes gene_type:complete